MYLPTCKDCIRTPESEACRQKMQRIPTDIWAEPKTW